MKNINCLKCINLIDKIDCKYNFHLAVDAGGEAVYNIEEVRFCKVYEELEQNEDEVNE